jgi:hypothetical protein
MENELRIIAGLEPEQLAERASALALEMDYWQQVLGDASKVNDAVLDGTNAVLEATAAALALMLMHTPDQLPLVEAIMQQHRLAITALKAISEALGETVDLAAGRQAALMPVVATLRRAAGLDTYSGDEPGA